MTSSGVIGGEMGELRPADHVAAGIDPPVRGSEAGVDLDAPIGEGDARRLEAEIGDPRPPPGAEQEMRALSRRGAALMFDRKGNAGGGRARRP